MARVDAWLDDPVFLAPFEPFFHARLGRPSTPIETYLRMMFLKYRYRLSFEAVCVQVSDLISWRRFCRISIDARVPEATTLMKLTSRCGSVLTEALNEALISKAVAAGVVSTDRVRVDTTVVEANVAYPTDSGLLAKAVNRMIATCKWIKAAGGAVRTRLRDRSRAVSRRAHALNAKLRTRSAAARDEAIAVVKRKNAELADLAEATIRDVTRLLDNAKRAVRSEQAGRAPLGGWKGRSGRGPPPGLVRAVNHLDKLIKATGQIIEQTRQRLADHACGSDPPGQPARSRRPPHRQGPGSGNPSSSATKPKCVTTPTASSSTTMLNWSLPTDPASRLASSGSPDAPAGPRAPWPPTAATANTRSRPISPTSASPTS